MTSDLYPDLQLEQARAHLFCHRPTENNPLHASLCQVRTFGAIQTNLCQLLVQGYLQIDVLE